MKGKRQGHPVVIDRSIANEILSEPVTSKLNNIMDRHAIRYVDIDDPGIVDDIDDPVMYRELLAREGARRLKRFFTWPRVILSLSSCSTLQRHIFCPRAVSDRVAARTVPRRNRKWPGPHRSKSATYASASFPRSRVRGRRRSDRRRSADWTRETAAYIDNLVARPSILALLTGKLRIGSVTLEDASLNLTRIDSEVDGVRWNFAAAGG